MKKSTLFACTVWLLGWTAFLNATEPARWIISEQKEFLLGELDGVSITSDGKLILAPVLESLFETEEAFSPEEMRKLISEVAAFATKGAQSMQELQHLLKESSTTFPTHVGN